MNRFHIDLIHTIQINYSLFQLSISNNMSKTKTLLECMFFNFFLLLMFDLKKKTKQSVKKLIVLSEKRIILEESCLPQTISFSFRVLKVSITQRLPR